MPKKFYEIGHSCQFHEHLQNNNICPWRHNLSQYLGQYANSGVINASNSFMKLAIGFNFINILQHNLAPKWHNSSHNLGQYADSSINYAERMFYEIS